MAPKGSASKDQDLEAEEEVLQAVILADSFNKRFRPLTLNRPRCLLPICNAPLLDWTFESLALAGVQEVFVIVRSHADQVKAAIRDSKWSAPSSGLKIVPIVTAKQTFSAGDAMRDVYTHGIITGDFVLVAGDLVSTVRIGDVVRAHKARRKENKDAIMTVVLKESGARHRTKSRGDEALWVVDPNTSECLHYESLAGYPPKPRVHVPREVLSGRTEVEMRTDLVDCGIDVCSVDVPSLFQDNFDYQDLRRDFLHGVLTSDLLMKNVHCYIVTDQYAAHVVDTRSYDAISKDILSRWTFPLVPDDNHPGGHGYEHQRGNRYIPKDNTVVLSRTCKVGNNTIIGSSTQVFDGAQITASVIGQRCTIGAQAVVSHAYIFDDTVIGAGAVVERSIIGCQVNIGDRSRVPKGCMIADGVVLGVGASLRPFEKVSKKPGEYERDDDDDDSDEEEFGDPDADMSQILGPDSNGVVLPQGKAQQDDDRDDPESFNNQRLMRFGDDLEDLDLSDKGSVTGSEDGSSSESEDGSSEEAPASASSSTSSLSALPAPAADTEFTKEVLLSLERAFAEGHSVDNAAVELKTLRMASNAPLARMRAAVVAGIVDHIPVVAADAAQQRAAIATFIERWGALITRIGGVDAVETISALQMHCASGTRTPMFGQVLAALYQNDVVDEDDVRQWHALPSAKGAGAKASVGENMKKCWAVGSVMIQQFDAQDDSDEESGESGESEESE